MHDFKITTKYIAVTYLTIKLFKKMKHDHRKKMLVSDSVIVVS